MDLLHQQHDDAPHAILAATGIHPILQNVIATHDNPTLFCTPSHMGNGMTMYMDGFHSTLLAAPPQPHPCINLFVSQWSLHTPLRFVLAMVAVVLLGIGVEMVGVASARYRARVNKRRVEGGKVGEESLRVQVVLTLFRGLQALMGYVLMLATMTYSIELLLSAVTGLSIGFFLNLRYGKTLKSSTTIPTTSPTNTPCCDSTEEDSLISSATIDTGYEDGAGAGSGPEKRRTVGYT